MNFLSRVTFADNCLNNLKRRCVNIYFFPSFFFQWFFFYGPITARTTLPNGTQIPANQYGPAVGTNYPLDLFLEDFEYAAGLGDLDEQLQNMLGQVVCSSSGNRVQLADLTPGNYVLTIRSTGGMLGSKMISLR